MRTLTAVEYNPLPVRRIVRGALEVSRLGGVRDLIGVDARVADSWVDWASIWRRNDGKCIWIERRPQAIVDNYCEWRTQLE